MQNVLPHHCMQPPPRSPHMPHLSDCRCLDSFATIGSMFLTSLISTSGIHIAHATCARFPVVVFLNNPPVRGHNSHSTCCILLKQALETKRAFYQAIATTRRTLLCTPHSARYEPSQGLQRHNNIDDRKVCNPCTE